MAGIDLDELDKNWNKKEKIEQWKGSPREQFTCLKGDDSMKTSLEFTGALGTVEDLWLNSLFGLSGDFTIINLDRSFNVVPSPNNPYYQSTLQQKDALLEKIRVMLATIGQNVNDLELVRHDIRKLKEFKSYFKQAEREKPNELPLKTAFVTQVDFYSGGSAAGSGSPMGRLSMEFQRVNNFMPTVVDDFNAMEPSKEAKDILSDYLSKDERFKNLSTVEKNFLASKWALYQEWKKMFKNVINKSYKEMKAIETSRRNTIKVLREDIKPLIARYKIMKDSLSTPDGRKGLVSNWTDSEKRVSSSESISVFLIAAVNANEFQRIPSEMLIKENIVADDEWTRENLLYGKKNKKGALIKKGLLKEKYPWVTEKWEWIKEPRKNIQSKYDFDVESSMYWTVYKVDYSRSNMTSGGTPVENGTFKFSGYFLSKNVLMAKLIELEADAENFEYEINELVGVNPRPGVITYRKERKKGGKDEYVFKVDEQSIEETDEEIYSGEYESEDEMKEEYGADYLYEEAEKSKNGRSILNGISEAMKYFNIPFLLFEPVGPYETRFKDRITKFYFPIHGKRFAATVVGTFKKNMKIGG